MAPVCTLDEVAELRRGERDGAVRFQPLDIGIDEQCGDVDGGRGLQVENVETGAAGVVSPRRCRSAAAMNMRSSPMPPLTMSAAGAADQQVVAAAAVERVVAAAAVQSVAVGMVAAGDDVVAVAAIHRIGGGLHAGEVEGVAGRIQIERRW